MARINIPAAGHGNKTEFYSDGSSISYNVFLNSTAKDNKRIKNANKAWGIINRLNAKIDLHGPCNKYFKSLPKNITFRHLWKDDSIFINFSPSISKGFYGATHSNDKDICISSWCLDNKNHWMLAAIRNLS